MRSKKIVILLTAFAGGLFLLLGRNEFFPFFVPTIFAHCDTESGPVVESAKRALETGNADLVLLWVKKEDEALIQKAFEQTLSVRKLNDQSRELADRYFFETLVRIHRANEGEPYTGIKPACTKVEPGIVAADKAIETGSADHLVKEISTQLTQGIRERFNLVMEKKKHKEKSVEAGREWVEAYVSFIHYVERLYLTVPGEGAPHGESKAEEPKGHHEH